MVINNYIPERGDIVWLNFTPQAGKEQHGVVLSDQIKSLDWHERETEFICKSSDEEMNEIIKELNVLIFSK